MNNHKFNKLFFYSRGNLIRAIELFEKAIPLAKSELEMNHLFSLKDAAVAQKTVAERFGLSVSSPLALI